MAYRRVGNDFMDEEEYEFHAIGVWSFWVLLYIGFGRVYSVLVRLGYSMKPNLRIFKLTKLRQCRIVKDIGCRLL